MIGEGVQARIGTLVLDVSSNVLVIDVSIALFAFVYRVARSCTEREEVFKEVDETEMHISVSRVRLRGGENAVRGFARSTVVRVKRWTSLERNKALSRLHHTLARIQTSPNKCVHYVYHQSFPR